MASTRGQRLRNAREKSFRSARAAALALGVPVSTYGAHERAQMPGGRDYGPEEARYYARWFDVTPEWLLTGLGHLSVETGAETWPEPEDWEKPTRHLVPLVGYVAAGYEAHYYDHFPARLEEMEDPRLGAEGTHLFELRDHGFGPAFDRWRVYFEEICRPVTPDLIGFFCVIGLDDGRIVLRVDKIDRTGGCPGPASRSNT